MFFHALSRVFKHRPRDPASVNGIKQTCVIAILACLNIIFIIYWISINKMASASNFRTSKHRHSVIGARNVFANNGNGELISQCLYHVTQGPEGLCQVKSHVQTARELHSHNLNLDFCCKQFRVMNFYARIRLYS